MEVGRIADLGRSDLSKPYTWLYPCCIIWRAQITSLSCPNHNFNPLRTMYQPMRALPAPSHTRTQPPRQQVNQTQAHIVMVTHWLDLHPAPPTSSRLCLSTTRPLRQPQHHSTNLRPTLTGETITFLSTRLHHARLAAPTIALMYTPLLHDISCNSLFWRF